MQTHYVGTRSQRRRAPLVLLSLCTLGLLLALAGPALAADGVRVIPTPLATPDYGQFEPSIGADILAYSSCDPTLGENDDQVIRLKFLWDDSTPQAIPRPDGYKDMEPAVLVDGGTIYVVWTRLRLEEPWDSHIMIWKGSYGTPPASGTPEFIPDFGYPTELVEGPDTTPLPRQVSPAIGLVTVGGDQHVVVAWEDSRDTAPAVPLVYWMDLTDSPTWDPTTAGTAADPTDFIGRGQHLPTVGPGGIYWLDERLSWWDEGALMDTAIWRLNVATSESAYFFRDTDHAYDNGMDEAPQVTYNGAAWLRLGPYGGAGVLPYVKPAGGAGHTVGPLIRPFDLAAYTKDGASTTGLAVAAMHADRIDAIDADIFYLDANTGARTAVCDRGNPAGATPDTAPDYFTYNQMSPAIGNAFYAYRVIWADQRDSVSEDSPDAKLYEAFVPTVRWSVRPTTILNLHALRMAVTVQPDFTGEPVKLQQVKPVRSLGGIIYKPAGRGFPATATMVAGSPNTSSSTATLKWTPKAKGTYYFRAWFPGAAKYTYDGSTIATGQDVVVPHVGNYSKVVKIIVK
jgi:hypothetical protein